ncbi:flagellar biosynthesis protein FliO [Pantoea dispersa EGD-AAK13]|jgi:flagellar protein FliO/FliZ|uniref:flagellar biosynthetic protein FliO n=1 Tax=Pantoea TaxID=53335 RepID=UPI000396C415|nr:MULTISPECIES: flagellar biosynthetic protein FliO [Pantoea]ERH61821.1 flagellar biosynthesis protein FliO [Pantoea dispersa EGD-AAK13]KTS33159.1 flagellar assembly protein FliO [Pantoea dispersa]KTS60012.1 flagellar assembly protein FliO [Pantoea dispersa]MCI1030238.1 flagellar biosynthetic protein FliO [Pantoea dispersa]MDR6298128.1 flagellar protein FliO/FliZ [Pantoea dispersa]
MLKNAQTVQPAHAQPVVSTSSVVGQVSSVLAVIVLLILACGWLAKRLGFTPKAVSGQALKVSASVQVGRQERVVIVDTADARLVLGVTAQQITHLHSLPPLPPEASLPVSAAPQDFRQLFQNLVKRPGKPQ